MSVSERYTVDLNDPRAPSLEVWERLSAIERCKVVDQLPSEIEQAAPEGDVHRIPKQRGLEALSAYFQRIGRRVYLSSELPVYYPGERMLAPDLIAVLDVESHERMRWVVTEEGRGLDFALEVTVSGSRKKDLEENVERFGRLGIPEYFVFDRPRARLHGFRLSGGGRSYEPIVPQHGRWASVVLGLELGVEADRFRFFAGTAVVPEADELLQRANALVDDLQSKLEAAESRAEGEKQRAEGEKQRAEGEKQRAEGEKQRAEGEKQRADEAWLQVEALRRELERLKGSR